MGSKNPLDVEKSRDDTCILCGRNIPNHHPDCEYYKFKPKAPPKKVTLKSLEARMRELEQASVPDFTAIMELSRKIEEFRKNLINKKEEIKKEKSFEDWAAGKSMDVLDPDQYGDGPAFLAPPPPPKPKPAKPKPKEPVSSDRLTGHLGMVKQTLSRDVLRSAYSFLTHNGKDKFADVISQTRTKQKDVGKILTQGIGKTLKGDVKGLLQEEISAKHLMQFKNVLKHGFKRVFDEQHIIGPQRHDVLFHLVKEMQEDFADIEKHDPGATKIMKNILAREFLSAEDIRRLVGRPQQKKPR